MKSPAQVASVALDPHGYVDSDVPVLFSFSMASERAGRMFDKASWGNLSLSHGVREDRHIRAVCRCGATAIIDPAHWISEGAGGQPLRSFEDRLRCIPCGARSVPLEIWYRKARATYQGAIYIFR